MAKETQPTRRTRVRPLKNLDGVVCELAQLYRDLRNKKTSTGTAKASAYILNCLRAALSERDVANRLERIEDLLHGRDST